MKALTWFIRLWVGFAILLNLIAIMGAFVGAPTLTHAMLQVADWYSPFNYWNWFAELLLFSPALMAYYWRQKLTASRPPQ